jgi:hypothetical protein
MRKLRRSALAAAVLAVGGLLAAAGFVGVGHASGPAAETTTGGTTTGSTTTVAAPAPPQNTSAPTVSGTPQEKQTLKADPGTWQTTTDATYAYAWQRCDAKGAACAAIANATAQTYTLTADDVGKTIRVNVTAKNAVGSSSAASAPTDSVAAAPGSTTTVAATDVELPNRLVVDQVQFTPNPVKSRASIVTGRFHVSDTNGRSVSGALVYMIGIPYNRIGTTPELKTGADGWVSFQFKPTAKFPIVHGGALVVFVRARTPQGSVLAGSSTRRLVQLNVTTP